MIINMVYYTQIRNLIRKSYYIVEVMMKKLFRHKGKLFLGLILILFLFVCVDSVKRNEYQPCDIITKEEEQEGEANHSKAKYYHINAIGFQREISQFQTDELMEFTLKNDIDSKIVGNHLISFLHDAPVWNDSHGKKIKDSLILDTILNKTLKEVKHCIMDIKILKDGDEYFVVYDLDVNWQHPFIICHYNQQKNKLEYITSFECEEVIGLRLNDGRI